MSYPMVGINWNELRRAPEIPAVVPRFPAIVRRYDGITTQPVDQSPHSTVQGRPVPVIWTCTPDIGPLVAGDYDKALTASWSALLPHSRVGFYHEAELRKGMTPEHVKMAHVYGVRLARSLSQTLGRHIPYGIVTSQGAAPEWDNVDADWWGGDVYDFHQTGSYQNAFGYWASRRPAAAAGKLVICETNSSVVAHRPEWFTGIFNELHGANGSGRRAAATIRCARSGSTPARCPGRGFPAIRQPSRR